jgi:hypothetical protein
VAWPSVPGDDLATVVAGDLPELPDAGARAGESWPWGVSAAGDPAEHAGGHRPSSPDILRPLEVAARKMTV